MDVLYYTRNDSVTKMALFSVMSVCGCVCLSTR